MGQKSRRKGCTNEIKVARLLSEWWEQAEEGANFKRTPLSGGWGNADTRGGFKVAGDICTTSKIWPFTVEVKRREAWSFGSFSQGRTSPVWKWWRQCIDQAAEENRIPLLWMKQNRKPWIVLAPERLIVPLLIQFDLEPDVYFTRLSPKVDDGDIRPACVFGTKFLQIPPKAWLPSRRRRLAA
jgi:hypothetical protein